MVSKELYTINYFDVYRDDSLIEISFNNDSKIVIGSNYYTEGLVSTSHKDNEGFVYFKQIDGEIESATYGEFLGCLLSKDKTTMNSKGKVVLFSNENLSSNSYLENSSKVSLTIDGKSSDSKLEERTSPRCSIRTGKISEGYLVEVNNKIYDKFKEGDLLYIDKEGNTHFGYISDYPYKFDLSKESVQIIINSDLNLEQIVSSIERFFMEFKS